MKARFWDLFLTTARSRVRRCLELIGGEGDPAEIRGEAHSLAGEAAMAGFAQFAQTARAVDAAARKWLESSTVSARVECARTLRTLSRELTEIEREGPPGAGGAEVASVKRPSGRRVLIIDDSAVVCAELSDALGKAGVEARTAESEQAAAGVMSQFEPDLILADANIPGVDTDALCARLRRAPHGVRTPIMLVSGLPDDELAQRAQRAGADSFVSKGHGLSVIVERVQAALEETYK